MSLKIRVSFSFFFFLISTYVYPQGGTGNSPYSQIGIGDIHSPAFVPNMAMGNTGISNANGIYINNLNPALLVRNRSAIFDVGVVGQYKKIMTSNSSQQDLGGNLRYLAYAFPVSKKWTLAASLRPYSSVDYRINSVGTIQGGTTPVNYTFEGRGGLNSVDFTNGVNIVKGLYVGVKASYLFGNVTDESISQIVNESGNSSSENRVAFVKRTNYSDITFQTGIAYRKSLRSNLFANAGFVYDFANNLNGKRLIAFQPREATGTPLSGFDTIVANQRGTVRLPAQYKFGFSLDNPFHWAIAADIYLQDWSEFVNFDISEPLGNSYTLALGGEYIPDISSVSSYFKRITYRAGLNYSKTPIVINGEQIEDFGINFGGSLPIRGFSDLNLAFTLGQRGTVNNNLIKEQYFKVAVGFTLNGLYDRWFVKNKID
jgi:long-subunit fatty acid transport protein